MPSLIRSPRTAKRALWVHSFPFRSHPYPYFMVSGIFLPFAVYPLPSPPHVRRQILSVSFPGIWPIICAPGTVGPVVCGLGGYLPVHYWEFLCFLSVCYVHVCSGLYRVQFFSNHMEITVSYFRYFYFFDSYDNLFFVFDTYVSCAFPACVKFWCVWWACHPPHLA